jgi:pimeloyl-ACP methyl ester carboxylesterase
MLYPVLDVQLCAIMSRMFRFPLLFVRGSLRNTDVTHGCETAQVSSPRIVLIHGAATTSRIWRLVVPFLGGFDVRCPDRVASGDLDAELDALEPLCKGAIVAGVSGGATLGLALAARGAGLAGALLHEPAVGTLLPDLLAPMARAYASGGPAAFAAALYGSAWTVAEAPDDLAAVGRDLAMFRAFEPSAPAPGEGRILITTGALSPPVRHESVRRLSEAFALPVTTLPGTAHAVHLENPAEFAARIRALAATRLASAAP